MKKDTNCYKCGAEKTTPWPPMASMGIEQKHICRKCLMPMIFKLKDELQKAREEKK